LHGTRWPGIPLSKIALSICQCVLCCIISPLYTISCSERLTCALPDFDPRPSVTHAHAQKSLAATGSITWACKFINTAHKKVVTALSQSKSEVEDFEAGKLALAFAECCPLQNHLKSLSKTKKNVYYRPHFVRLAPFSKFTN